MTIGVAQTVDSLNPFAGYLSMSYQVYMLMYDMLVGVDGDLNPTPQLAESWSHNTEGTVWTYNIVTNALWHDGTPLTAHDVNFTYNLILDNPGQCALYTDYLRNFTDVRALDNYTVQITTEVPKATMLSIIAPILPEHLWSQVPTNKLSSVDVFDAQRFPTGPVGSGPFMLVDAVVDDFWTFEKFEDYYAGTVNVDVLTYKYFVNPQAMVNALQSGSIDATTGGVPATSWDTVLGWDNIEGQAVNEITVSELGLNVCPVDLRIPGGSTNYELLNSSVRKAIAMAVNKTQIVDDTMRGQALEGSSLIPPASVRWHYNVTEEEDYDFDLVQAGAILDAAGYIDSDSDGTRENSTSGEPLSFKFNYIVENPEDQTAAYLIAGWLEQIGIDAPAEGVREDTLIRYWIGMEYDMYIWGWGGDADPSFLLSVMTTGQIPTSKNDWSAWSDCYYSNPYYDQLFIEQQNTVDVTERQQIVHEMQQILYRDAPYIVMYYPYGLYAYRTDRFTNWPNMVAHPGMTTGSGWTGGAWLFFEIQPVGGNQAPQDVSAGGDRLAALGETQSFTGTAYDPNNDPLTWTWTFEEPNGTTVVLDGQTVSYTFINEGSVNVTLRVTDGTLEGTDRIVVTVEAIANAGWLEGFVKDSAGDPILGALVSIENNSRTANETGYYNFTLAAGTYNVTASAPGHQTSAEQSIVIDANETSTLDFTLLTTSGTLEGWITDIDDGDPLADVTVVARAGDFSRTGVTNETGYYVITLLEAGAYTVTASKDGYITNTSSATITAGETTRLDLQLERSKDAGGLSSAVWIAIIVVAVIVVAAVVFMMMRKKKAEGAVSPDVKAAAPPPAEPPKS